MNTGLISWRLQAESKLEPLARHLPDFQENTNCTCLLYQIGSSPNLDSPQSGLCNVHMSTKSIQYIGLELCREKRFQPSLIDTPLKIQERWASRENFDSEWTYSDHAELSQSSALQFMRGVVSASAVTRSGSITEPRLAVMNDRGALDFSTPGGGPSSSTAPPATTPSVVRASTNSPNPPAHPATPLPYPMPRPTAASAPLAGSGAAKAATRRKRPADEKTASGPRKVNQSQRASSLRKNSLDR